MGSRRARPPCHCRCSGMACGGLSMSIICVVGHTPLQVLFNVTLSVAPTISSYIGSVMFSDTDSSEPATLTLPRLKAGDARDRQARRSGQREPRLPDPLDTTGLPDPLQRSGASVRGGMLSAATTS